MKIIFIAVMALPIFINAQTPNKNSYPTVTDIDGNIYKTVTLGTQVWMQENLKTTRYRDGSAIGEIEDSIPWANIYTRNTKTAAWCYYNRDARNNAAYGKLYNWYAVNNSKNICPAGWHVPADEEWTKLITSLGGANSAGGAMKSTTFWNTPNNAATNSSRFTGLPAGIHYGYQACYNIGNYGYFWTSSEYDSGSAWFRNLYYLYPNVGRSYGFKASGLSVRCVLD